MTYPAPVYLKCTPQTNGSAVMVELVQALPSTNDGYIYILLGRAYSATAMELIADHPVFYHDGTAIRLWTGAASSGGGVTSVNGETGAVTLSYSSVGAQQTPFVGTTATTTPAEAMDALQSGRDVYITHTGQFAGVDEDFRFQLTLTGESISGIVSGGAVIEFGGSLYAVLLYGWVGTGQWAYQVKTLASTGDIPTKTSDLTNDSGFLTSAVTSFNGSTGAVTYTAPVTSVNGSTGAVTLSIPSTAADVNALANTGGDVEGDVTLKAPAASNSPRLIFQRGTLTDNYNDWMIQDRGGYLYFDERGQGSSAWTNRVMFNTTGGVVATSFSGSGASLTGVVKPADIANMQTTGNLVTSVSASSTDSQYPSAKLFYDTVGNIEALLAAI